MRDFARYVILAPLMTVAATPGMAQGIPAGQSCGGLVCDLGWVGHKVPVGPDGKSMPEPMTRTADGKVIAVEPPDPHRLGCHDFICHAFGQPYAEAEATPAPAPAPVAAAPAAPAKTVHKSKHKHLAKAQEPAADSTAK